MSHPSSSPKPGAPRVIVIGAGISGLTCAHRLHALGVDAHVLESAPRAGGCIQTLRQQDWLLELGPNTYTRKPASEELVGELGLASEQLVEPMRRQPRYIYDGGRLLEVPMGPAGLLTTRILSPAGKLRLLREPFLTRRPPEEQSVADFIREHLGAEALEMLVGPFVSGVYAGDPERMSMPVAFPLIYDFARRRGSVMRGALSFLRERRRERRQAGQARRPRAPSALCSFPRGMTQLPEALSGALDGRLHCGLTVHRIETRPAGYVLHTSDAAGQVGLWEGQALVCATPAPAAAELLAPFLPEAATALTEIAYTPVMIAHLGAPLSAFRVAPRGFGFLVPRGREVRALGVLFTSAVFPGRAPDGRTLLTAFYGGATDPGVLSVSDGEIAETLRRDLSAALGWEGSCDLLRVTRWPQALPAYHLGHLEMVRRAGAAAAAAPAPLRFLGNWLGGISVPDCIRRARECAEELAGRLGQTR